jgi:hypothetical protein
LEASPELDAGSAGLISIADTTPGNSANPSGGFGREQKVFNKGRAENEKGDE